MSLPDEEPLDIEYANDPCFSGVAPDASLGDTERATQGNTLSVTYSRPHIQDDNDHMIELELRAKELARDYPHMNVEQWRAILLG
ncbi:hypothetical protein IQ229_21720 [Nostoc cf. edaphicum LEGE 07299]|uniref:Uncharacterized protein n=1 Tax=Nostoc cf. edaphicum LEGE 07299 TaxID=2777974 RepID=A0ABR9U457_9NOSO|nr:hypothetical protein [Nostoc edaphicum]MBE9107452.1 hypothetical protein [Nostoc cf. edaphicum LEGE 07299]